MPQLTVDLLERQRSVRRYRLDQFNLNEPTTIDGFVLHGPQWRRERERQDQEVQDYADAVRRHHQGRRHQWHVHHDQRCLDKVKFDAVKNVTKVRITALETAGQSAGEVNTYASAAELRVTTVRDVPSTEVEGQQVRSAEPEPRRFRPDRGHLHRRHLEGARRQARRRRRRCWTTRTPPRTTWLSPTRT